MNKKQLRPEVEENLIKDVQRLRTKNGYLKKFKCLSSRKNKSRVKKRVIIIGKLRHKYKLQDIFAFDCMPRSTFYYQLKYLADEDKHGEEKEVITKIFKENKGRYDIAE